MGGLALRPCELNRPFLFPAMELTYGIRARMTGDPQNFDLADETVDVLCPGCDRRIQMLGSESEKYKCACGWDGPYVVIHLAIF